MTISHLLQMLFLIFGCFCLLNGVIISMTSNVNLGNILTLMLGFVLLCVVAFWKKLKNSTPKWLKTTFFLLLAIVFIFSSSLYFFGKSDNVTYREEAIIVLGAGLRGERPSSTLRLRLNAAIDYHKKNPDALIVVSGGKGRDEDITEALAMERYLVSRGVPTDKIIKEEESTSTYENFLFSKRLIDEKLGKEYNCAYISNEYHIFRAERIAMKAGFENVTHLHCNTIWHSVLPGTLRECIAVMKYYILGS